MTPSPDPSLRIRAARDSDRAFILGLVPRFVSFELPPWRDRDESAEGVRIDLEKHLDTRPDASHMFIAETGSEPAGFLHLLQTVDFFTGAANCHISDLAVAPGMDGRGIGAQLLDHAESWAKRHGCRFMTLGVFPGNERARALYERQGYGIELLRMAKPLT
jgi:ribosomal protein S18 acetylase RimI-like enzyme